MTDVESMFTVISCDGCPVSDVEVCHRFEVRLVDGCPVSKVVCAFEGGREVSFDLSPVNGPENFRNVFSILW